MQNIKPLQTSKKIMSNKEAMEELERYNPKEETKENLETKVNNGLKEESKEKELKKVLSPNKYNNTLKNFDFYAGICISSIGAGFISTTPFLGSAGLSESDYIATLCMFLIGGSLLILLGVSALYNSYKDYKRGIIGG